MAIGCSQNHLGVLRYNLIGNDPEFPHVQDPRDKCILSRIIPIKDFGGCNDQMPKPVNLVVEKEGMVEAYTCDEYSGSYVIK